MNFNLTDEQKDIIKAAREFAEKEFPDVAQECDRKEEVPMHLLEKACELGFEGVWIPETYGGGGIRVLEKKRLMNFRNPRRYYAETFKELTR